MISTMPNSAHSDASCYVLGLLGRAEAIALEHRLCRDRRLSYLCRELAELAAAILLAEARLVNRCPCTRLRAEILRQIGTRSQHCLPNPVVAALKEAKFEPPSLCEAVVLSNQAGQIRWASPAFTQLCGYGLAELQGRTVGPLLQGADSDRGAAQALSSAVQRGTPALQRIVNYHKNGTAYWVEIDLRPVADGFVAVERLVEKEE